MKIDFESYKNSWKEFLTSKGFRIQFENENMTVFIGCQPEIRIEVYCCAFRTDTETHGCICGDFNKLYDKISKCPIYFDLTISEKNLWKAIEMLMEVGYDFSEKFGRIEFQAGQLNYNPVVFNKKEKI